jgi:hypothetical protein
MMRTTVTLDPDVAELVDARMAAERKGFKQVINEALRAGLARQVRDAPVRYEVPVFHSPIAAGVDLAKINQLLDEDDPALRAGPAEST